MSFKKNVLISAGVAAAGGAALAYGGHRWRRQSASEVELLEWSQRRSTRLGFDDSSLEGLPPAVARYFRRVLRPGQAVVRGVRLGQSGRFRTDQKADKWQPFTATQVFSAVPPAFVWDARIRFAPGVHVHVRDSYRAGIGTMRGEVMGLVPVASAHGTPEMAAGALQRYLAEAMWFPTRLLPGDGIAWTSRDDTSAAVTLADGATEAALEFHFDASGDLVRTYTPARYREVKGRFEPTPWEGVVLAIEERGGMRIPVEVEVAWHLPSGRFPYYRGRLGEIAYEWEEV